MQSQAVSRTIFLPETGFVRLPIVLKVIPVSRATWWQGIREGRYPRGYKLGGTRSTGWRVEDIRALIQKLSAGEGV
jgi:predicted DNA-binding transcriptional regulator AlpA